MEALSPNRDSFITHSFTTSCNEKDSWYATRSFSVEIICGYLFPHEKQHQQASNGRAGYCYNNFNLSYIDYYLKSTVRRQNRFTILRKRVMWNEFRFYIKFCCTSNGIFTMLLSSGYKTFLRVERFFPFSRRQVLTFLKETNLKYIS